jgi:16S rRNA (guanine527-N7)-methyltransferase
MDTLAAGAAALGLPLDAAQRAAFARYRDVLVEWNARINLTSAAALAEGETRHFLDSLTCVTPLLARWGPAAMVLPLRCIDVGSGGGFPGLPLRLALPRLRMTLVESTGKKVEVQDGVIAALGLAGVEAIAERAETLAHQPAYRESYDAAFARALAPLPALLELTLPFLRVGGLLVTQRRGDLMAEVAAAAFACQTLGGGRPRIEPVTVPPLDDGRALIVVEKAAATPAAYPRRPGVPAKQPLVPH